MHSALAHWFRKSTSSTAKIPLIYFKMKPTIQYCVCFETVLENGFRGSDNQALCKERTSFIFLQREINKDSSVATGTQLLSFQDSASCTVQSLEPHARWWLPFPNKQLAAMCPVPAGKIIFVHIVSWKTNKLTKKNKKTWSISTTYNFRCMVEILSCGNWPFMKYCVDTICTS